MSKSYESSLVDEHNDQERERFEYRHQAAALSIVNSLAVVADTFKTPIEKESYAQTHLDWINECIKTGKVELNKEDYRIAFSQKVKPGTTANRARCIHTVTGINIANDTASTSEENAFLATLDLKIVLEDYVESWKSFLTKRNGELKDDFTAKDFIDLFEAEATRTIRKKGPEIGTTLKSDEERPGIMMERQLSEVLKTQFEFEVVPRSVVGKQLDGWGLAHSSPMEDTRRGFDYWIYDPREKDWSRVDVTFDDNKSTEPGNYDGRKPSGVKILLLKRQTFIPLTQMKYANPKSPIVNQFGRNLWEMLE